MENKYKQCCECETLAFDLAFCVDCELHSVEPDDEALPVFIDPEDEITTKYTYKQEDLDKMRQSAAFEQALLLVVL